MRKVTTFIIFMLLSSGAFASDCQIKVPAMTFQVFDSETKELIQEPLKISGRFQGAYSINALYAHFRGKSTRQFVNAQVSSAAIYDTVSKSYTIPPSQIEVDKCSSLDFMRLEYQFDSTFAKGAQKAYLSNVIATAYVSTVRDPAISDVPSTFQTLVLANEGQVLNLSMKPLKKFSGEVEVKNSKVPYFSFFIKSETSPEKVERVLLQADYDREYNYNDFSPLIYRVLDLKPSQAVKATIWGICKSTEKYCSALYLESFEDVVNPRQP